MHANAFATACIIESLVCTVKGQLLFVDVETGGLDAKKHSVLQLSYGAFLSDQGYHGPATIETFYVIDTPIVVDPEALQYNGIDIQRVIRDGVNVNEACRRLHDFWRAWSGSKPVHMVAYNYALDLAFVRSLYGSGHYGQTMFEEMFSYRCVDMQSITRFLSMRHGERPGGFREACERYGVVNHKPHDAGSDVAAMMELWQRLIMPT